jgi:hypothetical protein
MLLNVFLVISVTLGAGACWLLHARHNRVGWRYEETFAAIARRNADLDAELDALWLRWRRSGPDRKAP